MQIPLISQCQWHPQLHGSCLDDSAILHNFVTIGQIKDYGLFVLCPLSMGFHFTFFPDKSHLASIWEQQKHWITAQMFDFFRPWKWQYLECNYRFISQEMGLYFCICLCISFLFAIRCSDKFISRGILDTFVWSQILSLGKTFQCQSYKYKRKKVGKFQSHLNINGQKS